MSTTFYSPAYKDNAGVDCNIRSKCVYDVSTSTTSVTVSGTIYLQHKGTKLNGTGSSIWGGAVTLTSTLIGPYDWTFLNPNRCYNGQDRSRFAITTTKDSGTYTNHSNWTDIYSKSFSFTAQKSTSAVTLYLVAGLAGANHDYYVMFGAYKSISIPSLASYAITYNANGGSGAPASQTKYYGTNITLSSTKPTRTNHVFKNWNTKSNGTGTTYNPGASYTSNAALTLYAQWYAPYTVTYNANGGTGGPTTQTKVYNTNLTLTTSQPTRSGYAFVKWNTKSDGTGTSYNSGATYSSNANVTLYAIWAAVPSIGTLTAVRCDENGDQDDEGEYATITCTWSCAGSSTIAGTITTQSGGSATSFTFGTNPSGSGTVTSIALVGSGNGMELDTDMQYTVSVTVTCITGGTTKTATRNVILTRAFFVMDWKAGGGAVGIGRAAPESGLEVGYAATFDSTLSSYGTIYGKFGEIYSDLRDTGITEYPRVATINGNVKLSTNSGNDVSSAQTVGGFLVRGKDNNYTSMFDSYMFPASHADHPGGVASRLITRNMKTDGSYATNTFAVYTHKDGSAHYSCTSPANFRSDLNIVSKVGDTMTGALNIKSSGIDRDGSNPSSAVWGQYVNLQDKDGERIGAFGVARETDGRTRVGLWAYNEKSDGTESTASLSIYSAKDGTQTYSLSSPAAFRNALGASSGIFPASVGGTGSAYFDTNPPADVNGSQVSVANDRTTTIATMTITSPGKYILHAGFYFASNANGRRIVGLSFDDAVAVGSRTQSDTRQPANGYGTLISLVRVINANSSYKIRANVYQNSGGALNCSCYMYAFRLK